MQALPKGVNFKFFFLLAFKLLVTVHLLPEHNPLNYNGVNIHLPFIHPSLSDYTTVKKKKSKCF